ncbi:MAG: Crp/Fnr family transcriptional regulator, partial [bacterium]
MIPEPLLKKYKARLIKLRRGDMIFHQGELAAYFHVVHAGKIKMMTYNNEGKEFVQGYFTEGLSFGEPPFFNHLPYPASAIAVTDSEIWKCSYDSFTKLLKDNHQIHLKLTEVLCGRLLYKSMMLSELAVEEAEHRLTTLIQYFKKTEKGNPAGGYKVPF